MRRAMLAGMLGAALLVAVNSTGAFAATAAPADAQSLSTTTATPPADVASTTTPAPAPSDAAPTSSAANSATGASTQAAGDVQAAALATDIAVEEHPDAPQPPVVDSNGAPYVGAGFAGTPDGLGAVTYGGASFTEAPSNAASWFWDGTAWSQVCDPCGPGARGFSGMGTFPSGVVLYGGETSFGTPGLSDTWIFADGAWTELCASCPPGPRLGPAVAGGGAAGDQMLLFGGASDFSGGPGTFLNDTWGFDGTTWTQLDVGVAGDPVARIGASMAWDGTRFILFGGAQPQTGGTGPAPVDDGTWAWAGDHWTQLCANAAACGPAPRMIPQTAALASTDPSRRGVLLVGGLTFSDSPIVFGDIWFWHDGQWIQQVSPWQDEQPLFTATPPVVVGAGLASLSALCQVSLAGQTSASTISTFSFGLDTNGDGVIDPCPVVPPPTPPTPTPTPTPDNVVVPAAEASPAAAEATTAGTLPFTGSEIAGPTTLAIALLGVGLILVAASRRRRVCRRARSSGMD